MKSDRELCTAAIAQDWQAIAFVSEEMKEYCEGFEISMLPYYSAGVGAAWLEKGGVKVIANIRGGGEYGERSWN